MDFVIEVRPIFEKHCHECHGAQRQKNDYRLDIKKIALTGGSDHAPNIVPGKSAESPLLRFVNGADGKMRMPPKKGLGRTETEILKRWIDEGAVWPDNADTAKLEDRTDWWAFKPLPGSGPGSIDDFINAKLVEKGLKPAPHADARTLIRRLSFDLTGLPPTPEEVVAFEQSSSLNFQSAYAFLVDRLLASPRYGERWARHWLDLVHYGETHGYDKDKPRNNAWPYRDYVIRALNTDKPYARFVEEQIAGDVLHPGTVDGVTALGLIAAGPWDLIGHMEVPESKTDGKIARHLDRDDMVQNTLGTFCSLTAQCAQCHDHKFDPITQEDYYSLQAVFAAVDRTHVNYYATDDIMRQARDLEARATATKAALTALEAPWIKRAGTRYSDLTLLIEGASANATRKQGNITPDFGYHSSIAKTQDTLKWVQVDLGRSADIESITLLPGYDDFNKIGAGFGFPVRFKIEVSDDLEFKQGVTLLWCRHDQTFMHDFPNPGLQPFTTKGADDDGIEGRYVRVTATKLAPRSNDFILALAELQVFDMYGKNIAQGRPVTSLDSIEAPPRWRRANLTDGIAPVAPTADERDKLSAEREIVLLEQTDTAGKARRNELKRELEHIEKQKVKLPAPQQVYAAAVHDGTGAFRGTGYNGGRPRPIHVLKRGDVKTPDSEVGPGSILALSELHELPGRFEKTDDEGARRAALARWITDKHNPLTWRSIVNRVWQHHFGRGIVDTANDFGRMGGKPTHPELLDWMAVTFRDEMGGSLKKLHKFIVMSETYRRAVLQAGSFYIDANNAFLSHQNRRKLDAESVRDSILMVSGRLDLTMGGPSFQDFVIEKPEHSPHYQYHLHDPNDPRSWRRSIYRFIVRSQQQPFMTVMDCADPSMRVDKRNESLSPLQALAMMNNGLTVAMASHFAGRVTKEVSGLNAQVRRAFVLALSRPPAGDELLPMIEYARREGLENTCRVLLNLNEFSFVD